MKNQFPVGENQGLEADWWYQWFFGDMYQFTYWVTNVMTVQQGRNVCPYFKKSLDVFLIAGEMIYLSLRFFGGGYCLGKSTITWKNTREWLYWKI